MPVTKNGWVFGDSAQEEEEVEWNGMEGKGREGAGGDGSERGGMITWDVDVSIEVLRVVVVVTVSISVPSKFLTSTVVLLAGSQRTTGTHSIVVVRRTITPCKAEAEI